MLRFFAGFASLSPDDWAGFENDRPLAASARALAELGGDLDIRSVDHVFPDPFRPLPRGLPFPLPVPLFLFFPFPLPLLLPFPFPFPALTKTEDGTTTG